MLVLGSEFVLYALHDISGEVDDLTESTLGGVAGLGRWEDNPVLKIQSHICLFVNNSNIINNRYE